MIRHWLHRWAGRPELGFRDIAVFACAFVVLFSVAWSFLNYHEQRPVALRKRSAIDTSTMLIFFTLFSWLLGRQVGSLAGASAIAEMGAIIAGVALVLIGCAVNVMGRHQLGPTWANQIAIYTDHRLLISGLFRLVRHPLYASTIWMFLGAGIAFLNIASLLATLFIFVPAMWYRARQEEQLLRNAFPEYEDYRKRTGAFFPRIRKLKGKNV